MGSGLELRRIASGGISALRGGAETGRPLVLLHGIGSNAQSFAATMAVLGIARPVIAWDAPGYGASSPFAEDWPDAGAYAEALGGLLDRLGVGGVDLLGHSLGALVAARFAVAHADRLHRLVLASPALGYGTARGAPLAPPAAARLDAMIAEGSTRFAESRGPRLVYARDDATLVAGVVKAMGEVKLPGYAQASRMLSCGDLLADARRIRIPTLVLVGATDEITPPTNCRRVHEAMIAEMPSSGHRFEVIAAAGHAAPQEKPGEVARLVAEFLMPDMSGT